MVYKIDGRDVDITFDGEYYVGTYDCIQIKRTHKIDIVNWFKKRFSK